MAVLSRATTTGARRSLLLKRRYSLFLVAATVTTTTTTTTTTRGWWSTAPSHSGAILTSAFSLDPPRERIRPSSLRVYSTSSSSPTAPIRQESEFDSELQVAIAAVRKACDITTKLQADIGMSNSEDTTSRSSSTTITKADASPVTIADFASQAVILQHLQSFFPNDIFLAEERSDTLTPEATEMIRQASGIDDEDLLKECIDLGQLFFRQKVETDEDDADKVPSTLETHSRFWCLDPIDGTKGFLRNEQYCVALGLVVDGIPTIGILACPNLPSSLDSPLDPREETGTIFVARRGHGCYELPLKPGRHPPIQLTMGSRNTIQDPRRARFCLGVEQGFSDPVGRCKEMAKILHGSVDSEGEIMHSSRMDSQAKWGVIARGDSEFYVRLPLSHQEWLWDVAPGVVVLEEVGGKVTDVDGNALDFSRGAKLKSNGILGAVTADLHQALIDAYRISSEQS